MKSIAVFCGANVGDDPKYVKVAKELGETFARKGIKLVYGAGRVGLMGIIANSILENRGEAEGVIPYFLKELEVAHEGLTKLHVVKTMHERKQKMADISDAVIVLPGGYGTLDEFFEILTWSQLGLHEMPIGLLNVNGYYDFLIKHMERMVEEKFMRPENNGLYIVDDNISGLLAKMEEYKVEKVEKWFDRV